MKMWIVRFGKTAQRFYTEYHTEQFARALRLNGTPYTIDEPETDDEEQSSIMRNARDRGYFRKHGDGI
jgi:uncharacterized protein with PIN domain